MFGIPRRLTKSLMSGNLGSPETLMKTGDSGAAPSVKAPVAGVRSMSFLPVVAPPAPVSNSDKRMATISGRARPVEPSGTAGTPPARSISGQDITLTDIRTVPKGRYASFGEWGVPLSFNDHFALLSATETHYTLLIDVNVWSSPQHMEIVSRLKRKNTAVSFANLRASRELILTLHKQNEAVLLNHLGSSTDIESVAWRMIDSAIEQNASDIHIETRGAYAQVFFRIFGERVEQSPIAVDTATGMCNVLYTFHAESRSKDVSWKSEEVMDTAMEHRTPDGTNVQVRFSSAPIHPSPNFHAVCRLLVMDERRTPSLPEVGFTEGQTNGIEDMLTGSQGMVLLVGPTNSGKSTTMQAMARRVIEKRGGHIKVITVEDPVEYIIPGACQMGVSHGRKQMQGKDGSAFNTMLKGILRQDPDVVIVGEIRDGESCNSVKDLVLAGRKLLSTLHVYEAVAVYARLRELGVPESILFMDKFISGVVYQRLVPTLCDKCSIPLAEGQRQGLVDALVYERVSRTVDLMSTNVRMRAPGGCEHCKGRGIVGRSICAEMLIPDETFLNFMRRGDLASARAHWQSNADLNVDGMGVTAVAHALCQMVIGRIDPHDIESQIGPIKVEYNDNTNIPGMAVSYHDGYQAFGGGGGSMRGAADAETKGNRLSRLYS